jgi:hypothetical protein
MLIFRRETRNYNFHRQRELEDMSQHIGRILQLLESGGLVLPEDEPDSAIGGGGPPKTGGRRESTAAAPRKASRGSMLSDSHISVGSLFGEEAEEEGGELLDDYTVAQLSARRRSNLGRIVEARTAAPVFFTFSPYNVFFFVCVVDRHRIRLSVFMLIHIQVWVLPYNVAKVNG